jgi:capsular polysaccharide biosynthesis protein
VFSVLESEYEGGGNVYPVYGVRNALVVNDHLTTVQLSLGEIASLIERYVLEKIDVPSIATGRKLYISRERDVEERSPYLIEGDASSGYEDNSIRLYGEVALERYLESRGFEIVKESALGSIEEQVRLMKSASVIVGVTGTGLTNVLFMNSENTVIELKTEILWSTGDHDANNHYNYLSYAKGHRYISLDVSNKQGSTAISKLERLFNALDLDKLV